MNMYPFTRTRFWTPLIILLHLVALLLPISAGATSDQTTSCGAQTLQSITVAPANADEEVKIPKETVDAAIFAANWRHKFSNAEQLEEILFQYFLITPSAELNATVLTKFRTEYETRLNVLAEAGFSLLDEDYVIHTILDVAMETPELAPAVPTIWQDLSTYSQFDSSDLATKISASAHRYDLGIQLRALEPQVFKQVYDCAQQNPIIAEVFDKFYSDTLNANIGDSAREVITQNSDFPLPPEILEAIGQDGSITISSNDLKTIGGAEFDKLQSSIDEMQEALSEIDKDQKVIIDYIEDQELKAKWQALMKKKAAEQQLKLDAVKSSISIITTLAGQIDPKFAKDFSAVANASLEVGQALNGWLNAVAGLKGLDKVFSLSTVVMTGNVLGAVMKVISLFGTDKPSPEQQILEEIGKLRQQVSQLRTEMHSRFDRIDKELNTIYTTMLQRFDQIDLQLGKINGNINEIQQSLVMIDLKLSRIERNNFDLLNAVGRRPLLEAINGGLGFRARTGAPMPAANFNLFENQYHSWATLHAFDSGNVGPTQRDYSDAGLLTELTTYPLDASLNYLNGWLGAHGLPAIANKPLPSPRDWLLASRAYTQLGLEEPEQMATFIENDPQRQARVNTIGVDLENAMQNISTILTPSGPQGNSLLFTAVVTLYQAKLGLVDTSIQTLETNFVNEVRGGLQRNETFNLFGGVTQTVSYLTPELTTLTCGASDSHGSFASPSNIKPHILNLDRYNLADYFNLGKITICLSDSWVDIYDACGSQQALSPDAICPQFFGKHQAILSVKYDNIPILTQWITDPGNSKLDTASQMTKPNWTSGKNYKGQFEGLFIVTPPPTQPTPQQAQLLESTTAKIETALGNYQEALYGRVINELSQGALRPLANELAGSKALIESFVTLGLPRATTEDEFLHAMLFGNQQLIDGAEIIQTYTLSSTSPISGTNLLTNPRPLIVNTANQRILALKALLDEILGAITAKTHAEVPSYIASARRALALTMRVVQLKSPSSPSDTNRVYLPVINR